MASCICGSDLWPYRGYREVRGRIGHEFVGVVEEVGSAVASVRPGDLVIAPFMWSCGRCAPCLAGWQTSCLVGGNFGVDDRDGFLVDGGQGEQVRVPQADGTLVAAPVDERDERMAGLLALSDVMGTGHHAAASAGVREGGSVAVIGDGAVGLCAVLAAARLGASRIIALSTHPDRAELARTFGATHVVAARDAEAVDGVLELTGGLGVDSVCECVGMASSWQTAADAVRAGARLAGWACRTSWTAASRPAPSSTATSRCAAGSRPPAATSRSYSLMSSPEPSTPHRFSPRRCRWPTSPTATARWTNGARSRCCSRHDRHSRRRRPAVRPSIRPTTRAEFLAVVASGDLTHSAMQTIGEPHVRILGDAAVLTTRVTNTAHYRGRRFDADEWTADVWVRRHGRWLCARSHITPARTPG